MSNTKNKEYEYLETSEEASKRGLKRITRPAFLGEKKSELMTAIENQAYFDVSAALMYLVSGRKG